MKIVAALSSLAISAFVSLAPQSAWALNQRSWVSNIGNDAAACTLAAPCATFGAAFAATIAGGTINCLNSGLYSTAGFLVLDKAITISCKGVVAAIEGGIDVLAGATDRVILEGISMDGHGTFNSGIQVDTGGFVYLIDSSVQGFNTGVNLKSTTANARFFIQNSTIRGNALQGIIVQPAGATVNIASVVGSLVDSNGPTAIKLNNAGATLGLQSSILNGSAAAITLTNGAQSYTVGGTNSVNGTFTFTGTIPLN
jgi:hypothetical protein